MMETGGKGVFFDASERVQLTASEPEQLEIPTKKSESNNLSIPKDDLQWSMFKASNDYVYVVVHYRSLIDNKNHSCKLKLRPTHDLNHSYHDAQKAVSLLNYKLYERPADHAYFKDRDSSTFDLARKQQKTFQGFKQVDDYTFVAVTNFSVLDSISCLIDRRLTMWLDPVFDVVDRGLVLALDLFAENCIPCRTWAVRCCGIEDVRLQMLLCTVVWIIVFVYVIGVLQILLAV